MVVTEMSMETMLNRLREFEGSGCLWRGVAALLVFFATLALPVVGAICAALIAVVGITTGQVAQAAIGAVVTGVFGAGASRMKKRRPWRSVVADRLWTWEKPNPTHESQVLVEDPDMERAKTAIRCARLNPTTLSVRVGTPPEDAPSLTRRFSVCEPEAWMQSATDADRVRRIVDALTDARVRARVDGVDVSSTG